MTIKQQLGRLKSVTLREAWQSEAGDFTPWLAEEENIKLLGDTIAIDLEVEAQEKNVGPFRADILCKDTANDQWVLIENQLERTDHTHLGQLITYAAGLNTVTIVWISQHFREEHRAALDWLNSVTSEDIRFFGLEVELWQIGNSPLAPKFNIVSSPNDWQKGITQGSNAIRNGEYSETRSRLLRFWTAFNEFLEDKQPLFRPATPAARNSMNYSMGRSAIYLRGAAAHYDVDSPAEEQAMLRAEVNIVGRYANAYYAQLQGMQAELEREIGEPLTWLAKEDVTVKRIFLRTEADLKDEGRWPEYHHWLLDKLNSLYRAFAPRAKALTIADELAADE